jgi:hypothetical protein
MDPMICYSTIGGTDEPRKDEIRSKIRMEFKKKYRINGEGTGQGISELN